MKSKKEKRIAQLSNVVLTPTEKQLLIKQYLKSGHPTLSAYIRKKLMATNISEAHKKKYDALVSTRNLPNQLAAIRNNITQIYRCLKIRPVRVGDLNDVRLLRVVLAQVRLIRERLEQFKYF